MKGTEFSAADFERAKESLSISLTHNGMANVGEHGLGPIILAALRLASKPPEGEAVAPFQNRAFAWAIECFGREAATHKPQRLHRFLEEALELCQSLDCSKADAMQLVDYVFGRPVGEPMQEIGGTLNTLAVLCSAYGFDMAEAEEIELARCHKNIEKIRAKQLAKLDNSALPGYASPPSAAKAESAVPAQSDSDAMDQAVADAHGAGQECGANEERAAIVAWLRYGYHRVLLINDANKIADAIEAASHLGGKPE